MKTALSLILCVAIATMAVADTQPQTPQSIEPKSYWIAGFVVILVVVAGVAIYKVRGTIPSQTNPETFVLFKTTDLVNWSPIATNTVTLHGTNAIEFFRGSMEDGSAWYRAQWVKR